MFIELPKNYDKMVIYLTTIIAILAIIEIWPKIKELILRLI